MLTLGMANRSTIDTAFLKGELVKMLEKTTLSIEELVRKSGVSRSVIYDNILNEKTKRSSIVVARKLADACGWGIKRDGDKLYFLEPTATENLDERNKKLIDKIKTLKPDAQEKVIWLIEQLAQKEK